MYRKIAEKSGKNRFRRPFWFPKTSKIAPKIEAEACFATLCKSPEIARRQGCVVIDNSSAFRMDPDVPLIIPEINGDALETHRGLIANPNCSTAVALMGLYPLHKRFGLTRFIASTYQAVSGAGTAGVAELEEQTKAHTS